MLKQAPQGGVLGPTHFYVGMGTALDNPYRLDTSKPRKKAEMYREWLLRMIAEKSPSHIKQLNTIATPLMNGEDVYLIANGHYDESYVQVIMEIINEQLQRSSLAIQN